MEKQARRIIFIILLTTLARESFVSCLGISSQIDLDSEENEPSSNNSTLKAFVNLNEGAGRVVTSSRTKTSAFASDTAKDFVRGGEQKKRRSHLVQDDASKQPTVINNIQIVVNGNETKSGETSCANGICDVSVSSKPDGAGNIVTDVHLSIVTKLNTNPQVGDIPVVDGVRGVENTYDHPPDFYLLNHPRPRPHYFNNIPQIQSNRQGSNEPWYSDRRIFQGSQPAWHYHRPGEYTNRRFQGHVGWVPSKPIVDDKIEPPLSKTQSSDE